MSQVFNTGDSMTADQREGASRAHAERLARAQFEDACIYVRRDLAAGVIDEETAQERIADLKQVHGIKE